MVLRDFCAGWSPHRGADKYGVVKRKFRVEFLKKTNPKEEFNECVVAGLEIEDLGGLLTRIEVV